MHVSDYKATNALNVFEKAGGTLRTSEALERGIHPRTLYYLRDTGQLETLSRGLYRLAEKSGSEYEDLVIVAGRAPEAVVTLISALAFHELTDEVPHAIYIALPRGKRTPLIDYPPLDVVHVSEPAYSTGIEVHEIDGIEVKVYDAARAVVDSFKFRNQIGKEVAIDALKRYLSRSGRNIQKLTNYGDVCRVRTVMQPYMEALI